MAERPGGSKPHELDVDGEGFHEPLRGPLPSYERFEAPVTKVDDQIDQRIMAMRNEQAPNEDTDVRLMAQAGSARVASSMTAEMIPPAPLPPTLGAALRQAIRFAG